MVLCMMKIFPRKWKLTFEQINDNLLTGACLLDISKSFYFIHHEILLAMTLPLSNTTPTSCDIFFSNFIQIHF